MHSRYIGNDICIRLSLFSWPSVILVVHVSSLLFKSLCFRWRPPDLFTCPHDVHQLRWTTELSPKWCKGKEEWVWLVPFTVACYELRRHDMKEKEGSFKRRSPSVVRRAYVGDGERSNLSSTSSEEKAHDSRLRVSRGCVCLWHIENCSQDPDAIHSIFSSLIYLSLSRHPFSLTLMRFIQGNKFGWVMPMPMAYPLISTINKVVGVVGGVVVTLQRSDKLRLRWLPKLLLLVSRKWLQLSKLSMC